VGAASTLPAEAPPFLQQAESLHAQGQDDAAAALWIAQGRAALNNATPAQQPLFWPAQDRLARALLMTGDAKTAYALATATDLPITARGQIADRDFFAGFLALRFLHHPANAAEWFNDLLGASPAVITQARGYYWLARTESGPAAQADYARAAAYPDTFYGQLAALALGYSPTQVATLIQNTGEPAFTTTDAITFALGELPRAAALLVQMNDPKDAQIFLNRIAIVAADGRTRELAAKLALGLGYPASAVAIARTAGIAGQMLIREGWPLAQNPPATLEPAIALGIMRQESSFDPTAISGAGAEGLMQLLPSTARLTARANALPDNNLFDPTQNMVLGTAYLADLIQQFDNCLPMAIAAYNAGPVNVSNWVAENGDPALTTQPGGADIIDWIEEIPFNETRNYVQRVTESIVIYRALESNTADNPLSPYLSPTPAQTASAQP